MEENINIDNLEVVAAVVEIFGCRCKTCMTCSVHGGDEKMGGGMEGKM